MRFFSNDKDSHDEQQGVDVQERAEQVNPEQAHDEHPERVTSDPVSVPQQRAGSPWSSTPDSDAADAELAARERMDGTDDAPPFHEPSPQPTAFGASTVGGAVAASATANPLNDTWSATDRESAANSGVGDDRSVAPGDGVVDDRDGTPAARSGSGDVVDVALDDQGTFDDPHVRDADTTTREDTTPPDARSTETSADGTVIAGTAAAGTLAGATSAATAADRRDRDRDGDGDTDRDDADRDRDPALKDEGTFDDPRAVDPDTHRALDDAAEPTQSPPVVTPVATGTAAGSPGGTPSLFDADDARSFQERWRDVQLRFVDSPKEATAEAAGLLDEAVDRLAAGLRAQKSRLAGDGTEDTEKLRVELRGYRDMLNRILDL